MRPGAATATCVGGAWLLEAPARRSYALEVGDDWELQGEMVEVKSAKDNPNPIPITDPNSNLT